MKSRLLLISVILFGITLHTSAKDISLDEAIRMGLEGEDMKIAEYNINRIDASIQEIYASNYPTLNLTANYKLSKNIIFDMSLFSKESNLNAGLEASYLLFAFGAIQDSVDAIRSSKASIEIQKEITKAELSYAVRLAYYSCLISDEILDIVEISHSNALKSKQRLESQATVRVSQSDLTKVSADIASRKTDVEIAKVNKAVAYRLLKSLMNYEGDEDIKLTSKFDLKALPKLDKDKLISYLNPSETERVLFLSIYDKQIESDRLLAKSKDKAWLPKLSLIAGYSYANAANLSSTTMNIGGFNLGGTTNTDNAYIGVALSFAIFDGFKSSGQSAQSTIDSYIKASQKSIKRRDLKKEVNNSIADYISYLDVIKLNDEAILLGQRAYDLSLARFLNGQTSATELNDVERSLSALKQSKVNSINKIYSSLAIIEKYLGRLD